MEISDLEKLEQKYNFKYPKLYKTLCSEGMLNTGKYGGGWIDRNYERIKDNPIFLIWSYDVEILEDSKLEEYINDIQDFDTWNIDPKLNLKLIPFAQTGGGDLYCFYYNEQNKEDIPIVMVYHDEYNFIVLAKNLQDFIFRILLETASSFYIGERSLTSEYVQKTIWDAKSMLKSHKKYLAEKQYKILEDIYQRDCKQIFQNIAGMITEKEVDEIIINEINFSSLNKEIPYNE